MDIREKEWVSHEDILALNFIRERPRGYFRQHHRQGLRSVIMEILDPQAIETERQGVVIGGVRRFPAAVPQKIFRIFRTEFDSPESALRDIRRFKVALAYLTLRHMAVSQEMLLSYRVGNGYKMTLCGLQAYTEGEPLDMWGALPEVAPEEVRSFIQKVKLLAGDKALIADLAGIGNIVHARAGSLVLVDINNFSEIHWDSQIHLDDKGYPACDKSVEALSLLESRLLKRNIDLSEPLYAHFLSPARRKQVEKFIRHGKEGALAHGQNQG